MHLCDERCKGALRREAQRLLYSIDMERAIRLLPLGIERRTGQVGEDGFANQVRKGGHPHPGGEQRDAIELTSHSFRDKRETEREREGTRAHAHTLMHWHAPAHTHTHTLRLTHSQMQTQLETNTQRESERKRETVGEI